MDIIQLLQTFGLPTVLVLWFMLRTEKIIERNTNALSHLAEIEAVEVELLRQIASRGHIQFDVPDGSFASKSEANR